MRNWWGGTHRRPTWRKAGVHEGFRQVAVRPEHVERLNRHWGRVFVPKCGWVRFRWTRQIPDAKSYRVTCDRMGRWHVAFAHKPAMIDGPGTGETVGVDRGIANSATLSTGEHSHCPTPTDVRRAARKLSRAKRGSNGRRRAKRRVAVLQARDADRRKDFVEKLSTDLARRFDVVRMEDLRVKSMTRSAKGTIDTPGCNVAQKAGLNRAILANGWGLLQRRTMDKIGDRLELVPAAYTSIDCSACGNRHREQRESQARFRCRACNFVEHADVNAALNIARGHRVTARGGIGYLTEPLNREPQLAASG